MSLGANWLQASPRAADYTSIFAFVLYKVTKQLPRAYTDFRAKNLLYTPTVYFSGAIGLFCACAPTALPQNLLRI
jgi:hypothetical protein